MNKILNSSNPEELMEEEERRLKIKLGLEIESPSRDIRIR